MVTTDVEYYCKRNVPICVYIHGTASVEDMKALIDDSMVAFSMLLYS